TASRPGWPPTPPDRSPPPSRSYWDSACSTSPVGPSVSRTREGRDVNTVSDTRPPRPRAGWRQVGRDLMYLLPGLPIAIASFTLMMVGFWLGIGLTVVALLGLVFLLITLLTARGLAAAERARVGLMEGRRVGP